MFYIPHSIGLIIAVSPKCGSTSFRNEYHIPGTRPLSLVAVQELKKSFWKVKGIVRDPIDRFESCYNFFQHKHNGGFPLGKKYKSLEAFTDAVLSGDTNPHWQPQSEMLQECDTYADLETVPLKHHINKNEHKERAVYRLRELKEFYAQDYKIRGGTWL